jgi:hypothetical protein
LTNEVTLAEAQLLRLRLSRAEAGVAALRALLKRVHSQIGNSPLYDEVARALAAEEGDGAPGGTETTPRGASAALGEGDG